MLVSHPQTSRRAATSRKTGRAAPRCAKQAATAATRWPAASAAHTPGSTTASVRRDTTARGCSTSAQVGHGAPSQLLSHRPRLLSADKVCTCKATTEQLSVNNCKNRPNKNQRGVAAVFLFLFTCRDLRPATCLCLMERHLELLVVPLSLLYLSVSPPDRMEVTVG